MMGLAAGIRTAYNCPYHYYFVIDGQGIIRWRGLYNDAAVRAIIDTALGELGTSAVGDLPDAGARLLAAYPNPFNPLVRIPYELDGDGGDASVRLEILDLRGRVVQTLVTERQARGQRYEVPWPGTDSSGQVLASGVYLARLTVDGHSQTTNLTLVR